MPEHFLSWPTYWGLLHEDKDERFPSRLFGYENLSKHRTGAINIAAVGACYGFVSAGAILLHHETETSTPIIVHTGQWFSTANGCRLTINETEATAVMIAQRIGFRGINTIGGPIENKGRLRYIDGCSDSLLCCPPLLGDPCLNHLHFPAGIDQSQHTHPSLRAGIVAKGTGWCTTPEGITRLHAHLIFAIPRDGLHSFRTGSEAGIDVIPYHPDSDWGPSHEEQPMVNRTWVQGRKINNTEGVHAIASLAESAVLIGDD
jgi:hypothetical protein